MILVEDNQIQADVVKAYFRTKQIECILTANGLDAVEMRKRITPEFILLDIKLPDIPGYEVIERIRAFEQERQIKPVPIFVLSAHAMPGVRERCLKSGANEYFSKPIPLAALTAKIEEYLCRE